MKNNFKKLFFLFFILVIFNNTKILANEINFEAQNIKTIGGLGMLLYQAVPSFESFFGVRPEVTNGLKQHILEHIRRAK